MDEKAFVLIMVQRLQKHYAKYEPVITTLKNKYESAVRAKSLIAMERDKLQAVVTSCSTYCPDFNIATRLKNGNFLAIIKTNTKVLIILILLAKPFKYARERSNCYPLFIGFV